MQKATDDQGAELAAGGNDTGPSERLPASDICWCRKNPCVCSATVHDRGCEAELTSHGYTPCRCGERGCNICRQHQHAKWHDYSNGKVINPIALLEFIDSLPDGEAKDRTRGWVTFIAGIAWPLAGNQPTTSGIASTAASSAQKRSNDLGLMKETDADQHLDNAIQAVWDAAWALHDPVPDGRQWRRSQALKEAIDQLVGCETDSALSRAQVQEKKDDHGGTSLTAGDSVSGLVPTDSASHVVEEMKRQYDAAALDDIATYRLLAFNAITALALRENK